MTHAEERVIPLTAEDAFAAMFAFLNIYWKELGNASLSDVLSEMNPAEHGQSSDPGAWADWVKCVRGVTEARDR